MKKIYIIIIALAFLMGCSNDEEIKGEYDVIVLSGEPEGVSAAVSAARHGASVLLIEHRDSLGGLMTHGMLNYLDLPQNDEGTVVSKGIFEEWHQLVGGTHINTVDLDVATDAFRQLVDEEENIDLLLNTEVQDVRVEDSTLQAVQIEDEWIEGERFIDSSPDGDLAAMAGAPYFIGQADINKEGQMAATLMIYLENVDWDKVKEAANNGVLGGGGVSDTAAWGFADAWFAYDEVVEDDRTNIRGLNIGRTEKGEVFINTLQIFDVDGLDEESQQEALEIGKKETESFVPWLRENLPGFEDAEIVRYPDELYIRETRHIESEYMLKITDLWENKHHWDDIAIGGYPADIQATSKFTYGSVNVNPNQYGIPFRSLVPLEVDNLLVASKASGYSSLAAGSARVIPTGMATAEAAGVASTISIENDLTFREMNESEQLIEELQNKLVEAGAYLEQLEDPDYAYKGEPYYPAIKNLLLYDLVNGGYQNDLRLDEEMLADQFIEKMVHGIERLELEVPTGSIDALEQYRETVNDDEILTDRIVRDVFEIAGWEIERADQNKTWSRLDALLELEYQIFD
ncbi:FAD-dependent oxidoreductase [Tenuibacillus multivorans]|uniref:FAD dependent oxidoreductase n=1 Tax=Tenuibacillus multivorans TaxID=237069 RepID=A0A1H0BQM7_9BACI|nr:FAD-dependent oxidoreductase [Tenuibacillus multivorans]GEL77073.1 hypothetical protein TMU01_13080 [Tenuibacillus multivorans]SDN47875.1 FAD dependent oxidoreductase [Tenuibacillus multivorans]